MSARFSPARFGAVLLKEFIQMRRDRITFGMMIGLPIVGLATTEMATAVEDGVTGFLSNDPARLIGPMRTLLEHQGLALEMGERARRAARDRFSIGRFAGEWEETFSTVAGRAIEGSGVAPGFELGSVR